MRQRSESLPLPLHWNARPGFPLLWREPPAYAANVSRDVEPFDWAPERELLRAFCKRAAAVVDYAVALSERRRSRQNETLTLAVELSGSDAEQLLRRAESDAAFAHLLTAVMEAAARSQFEAKVQGLARALSMGYLAQDTAQVDLAQLMAATVDQLDAVHVRALVALDSAQGDTSLEARPGLAEAMPEGLKTAEVMRPICARLSSLGMLELDPPGFGGWQVTAFGSSVLAYIRNASGEVVVR